MRIWRIEDRRSRIDNQRSSIFDSQCRLFVVRAAGYFLGIRSTEPTVRLSGFGIWLTAMMSRIVTPYFSAIPLRLSPRSTVYSTYPAAAVGAGVSVGGTVGGTAVGAGASVAGGAVGAAVAAGAGVGPPDVGVSPAIG